MEQIHKLVQALESDIEFWQLSWILLFKKLKNAEKILQGKFSRANMHTANEIFRNNPSRGVRLYM